MCFLSKLFAHVVVAGGWGPGGSFDDEDSELEGSDDDTQRPHFLRHFWENDPYLFILS